MRRRYHWIMKTGQQHKPRPNETLTQWWKRFNKTKEYEYTSRWGTRIRHYFRAEHHDWFLKSVTADGFCTRLLIPTDMFGFIPGEDITVEKWLRLNDVELHNTVLHLDDEYQYNLYLQDDTLHAILKLKLDTR